jgi:hypothetical protein
MRQGDWLSGRGMMSEMVCICMDGVLGFRGFWVQG